MDLLTVTGIGKKDNEKYLVQQVDLSVRHGQQIGIAGETGAGKSTLLKLIAGLLQPDEGSVSFEGVRVPGPYETLIPGHPRIAWLSQYFELRKHYRVEEELESSNLLSDEEAARIYQICRITHLLKRKTTSVSGGERQRIVLARLLTTSPKLLLLDEPYSNLDAPHKAIMQEVLATITGTLGISCILVSHDTADLLSRTGHILLLRHGRIVQQGRPETLYNCPADTYCAGLFGEFNLLGSELAGRLLQQAAEPPGSKKLFLRPEQLLLGAAGEGVINGLVENVQYYGAYSMVTLLAGNEKLRVRTVNHAIRAGEEWAVRISGQPAWYLQPE